MMEDQWEMTNENYVDIFKALSNNTRVVMLQMLKEPERNFPTQAHKEKEGFRGGVCVKDIRHKINLGQSTLLSICHCYRKVVFWEWSELGSGRIIEEMKK